MHANDLWLRGKENGNCYYCIQRRTEMARRIRVLRKGKIFFEFHEVIDQLHLSQLTILSHSKRLFVATVRYLFLTVLFCIYGFIFPLYQLILQITRQKVMING